MKNIVSTDDSVKRQITVSISENLTDSDLESMDSNQYAIELVTYLLVLVAYFNELIVYMLLERNAIDSIAFFYQCTFVT